MLIFLLLRIFSGFVRIFWGIFPMNITRAEVNASIENEYSMRPVSRKSSMIHPSIQLDLIESHIPILRIRRIHRIRHIRPSWIIQFIPPGLHPKLSNLGVTGVIGIAA